MSLLKLPEIKADARLGSAQFDLRQDALERWAPEVRAAQEGEHSISMYGPIGENWSGDGITAKRIGAALRNIGDNPVTVNVNSPGGDFFEGVAIYNLLRQHSAKVTINVMALAASAASVIAMAGDEIKMGEGAFLMIHNAWVLAAGNRHDMREVADYLEPFDSAMADLYAARTGLSVKKIKELMDAESYINTTKAIEDGFATGKLEREAVTKDTKAQGNKKALALVEAAMAKAGYTRSARRDALQALFTGKPGAADEPAMSCAGEIEIAASLQSLINTLKG